MPHLWMKLARVSWSPCYLILPAAQPGEKALAYVAILIGLTRERDGTKRDGERVAVEK